MKKRKGKTPPPPHTQTLLDIILLYLILKILIVWNKNLKNRNKIFPVSNLNSNIEAVPDHSAVLPQG